MDYYEIGQRIRKFRRARGLSQEQLAEKIPGCTLLPGFEEIDAFLRKESRPGDLILTMGCGNIYEAAHLLARVLPHRA